MVEDHLLIDTMIIQTLKMMVQIFKVTMMMLM